jgi:hypothetical protein
MPPLLATFLFLNIVANDIPLWHYLNFLDFRYSLKARSKQPITTTGSICSTVVVQPAQTSGPKAAELAGDSTNRPQSTDQWKNVRYSLNWGCNIFWKLICESSHSSNLL